MAGKNQRLKWKWLCSANLSLISSVLQNPCLKKNKKDSWVFKWNQGSSVSGWILALLCAKNLYNRSKCLRTSFTVLLNPSMLCASHGWVAPPSRAEFSRGSLRHRAPRSWEGTFLGLPKIGSLWGAGYSSLNIRALLIYWITDSHMFFHKCGNCLRRNS